jgi:hypothetical protein
MEKQAENFKGLVQQFHPSGKRQKIGGLISGFNQIEY